ncbi:MAG: DNA polymerase III subunit beta [Desulfobaccales bacterium]
MEATIGQSDFQKAISAVLGVVDKRGSMPILSNVLLKANGDGGIQVSATDLEVSYKGFCPARIETPGAITVPAHQLATLIKDMPGGDLQVETTENYSLKIFQGEAKYRLHGLDPEQFPNLPDAEEGVGYIEIPSSTLKEMIKRVIFSVSMDDLQYHLSSVLWENLDGQALRMVSTDGHRLTVTEHGFPLMGLMLGEGGIQVPRKGMAELLRFLENSESVSLAVQNQVMIAKAGDRTLTIRLLDKRFPDYRRIIPEHLAIKWTFSREEMFRTLKRLALVNTERFKGVVFTPQGDHVSLKSENPDIGDGLEIVSWTEAKADPPVPPQETEQEEGIEGEGDKETASAEPEQEQAPDFSAFGFNIRYLLDPLAVMSSETVELEGNRPDRPFRIRPVGDNSFFSIVMPMGL